MSTEKTTETTPSPGSGASRQAAPSDIAGMAWWNNMSETQRAAALKAADTDCPAEAWALGRCQPSRGAFALTVRGDSMVDAAGDVSFPDD